MKRDGYSYIYPMEVGRGWVGRGRGRGWGVKVNRIELVLLLLSPVFDVCECVNV